MFQNNYYMWGKSIINSRVELNCFVTYLKDSMVSDTKFYGSGSHV